MQYVNEGHTGLKVSRILIGTMTFGKYNDEKDCFRIMDMAKDFGINYLDTGNLYGGGVQYYGRVEEILGRYFKLGGNRRESFIVNTKCFQPMHYAPDGPNDSMGLSAFKIYRSLEASLRRMQTDHVEIYTTHHCEEDTNWDEIYGAYENIISQGKTYYVGSSNYGGRHLVEAKYEAQKRNFLGFISEQTRYNLFCRLPELEVMPACKKYGIAFNAYAPLAGGFLANNALDPKEGTRGYGKSIYSDSLGTWNEGENRNQLLQLKKLADDMGETMSTIALAWQFNNPNVSSVICGCRTPEQLEASVHALDVKLGEDVMKELDRIFPGPGGPGPQAYIHW